MRDFISVGILFLPFACGPKGPSLRTKKGILNMRLKEVKVRLYSAFVLATSLCACGNVAMAQENSGSSSLGILGYNYTDRYIGSFTVNGQGGGNIYVSSSTSGGSGLVCCTLYRSDFPIKTVRVRWQSGACYFKEKSSLSSQIFDRLRPFFKEQDVPLDVLAPTDAHYLEVHFYPDGSIKAAVTAKISSPRLLLEQHREDLTSYPRCTDDF